VASADRISALLVMLFDPGGMTTASKTPFGIMVLILGLDITS
jgi:hypothetical protein